MGSPPEGLLSLSPLSHDPLPVFGRVAGETMSDVGALAALKWAETRNRAASFAEQSRFKIVVVALFSVTFWISLFQLFYSGMSFLQRTALQYNFAGLIGAMFY